MDLQGLQTQIAKAFDNGESVAIKIEMGDDPTNNGTLILNGKAAPFVALAEIAADPAGPVFDLAS